ncbi:hypothetical protein C7X68_21920 [Salmonella enterica subsp. enterica serovar Infantis]|nr:hypothetical protein [Salmonella enterica subsp. enterica serovar Infantis]
MRNDGFVQNIHSDVIAKARVPEARAWLIQNKSEYMALILDIKVVKVG